jgi:hypothetical protein
LEALVSDGGKATVMDALNLQQDRQLFVVRDFSNFPLSREGQKLQSVKIEGRPRREAMECSKKRLFLFYLTGFYFSTFVFIQLSLCLVQSAAF